MPFEATTAIANIAALFSVLFVDRVEAGETARREFGFSLKF